MKTAFLKVKSQAGASLTEYVVAVLLLIVGLSLIAVPVSVEELNSNGQTVTVSYPSQLARIVTNRMRVSLGSISGENGMAPCVLPNNAGPIQGQLDPSAGECY
jgi:hypothetical protein